MGHKYGAEDHHLVLAAMHRVTSPFGASDERLYCCLEGIVGMDSIAPHTLVVRKMSLHVTLRFAGWDTVIES